MAQERLPKGITKRGSKYRVSIMVNGVRRTETCDTLPEAVQEAERIRLGASAPGKEERLPVWTMQEASDALMRERIEVNATSQASIYSRRSTLKKVVEFYGPKASVDQINYAEVMRLSHHLRVVQGFGPAYTNSLLVTLKMLLDHAWRSGRKSEPPVKIEFVKDKPGRIRYLLPEEERLCLEWLDHHAKDELKDAFLILLDTGLRPDELMNLPWTDVDFDGERIHVWKSKSKEPRAVPMTSRVKAILKRRRLAMPATTEKRKDRQLVMYGRRYRWLNVEWAAMREALGLEGDQNFVPYILRHTCCTRLVSGGVDLRTVQRWMGHEDIQTTMRYAQFVPDNLFRAAAALEKQTDKKPDLRVVEGGE